jgi:hypothetical protein
VIDEGKKTEPSSDNLVVKIFGPLISIVVGTVLGWLPGGLAGVLGPYLMPLGAVTGGIGGLVFYRYVGVLGAGNDPKGSPERKSYDALRKSLRGGNIAVRLYSDWLIQSLDAVDRFFGDAGMADRTLFPRVFGLKKTPAPLWTAPAFDRCLLLALLYPIATIFTIWAVSGHVGPAEAALGLKADIAAWRRGLAVAFVGVSIVLLVSVRTHRMERSKSVAGAIAIAGVLALALILTLADASAVAVAVASAVAAAVAGSFAKKSGDRVDGSSFPNSIFAVRGICEQGGSITTKLSH